VSPNDPDASRLKAAPTARRGERELDDLLIHVARGDQSAFESVYDRLAGPVYGVIRRVLRDPSQAEEVAQEVLLEVWRTAARFDPAVGGAATWVMTIAHRRAIDRVRSATAAAEREQKTAEFAAPRDEVVEAVEASLDRERVRSRCSAAACPPGQVLVAQPDQRGRSDGGHGQTGGTGGRGPCKRARRDTFSLGIDDPFHCWLCGHRAKRAWGSATKAGRSPDHLSRAGFVARTQPDGSQPGKLEPHPSVTRASYHPQGEINRVGARAQLRQRDGEVRPARPGNR
jgi:RNA polymerase sigma-70 factor (ECF subfamily)